MINDDMIPSFGIEDINPNDPNVDYLDKDLVFVDDMRRLPDAAAMKFKMNLMLMCLHGRLSVVLNGQRIEVGERQLLLSHSNVIADDYMVSPNYEGKLLMVSDRMAKMLLGQYIDIWQREFYERPYILVSLNDRDFTGFTCFYQLTSMKMEEIGTQLHREVILVLLQASLLDLCSRFQSAQEQQAALPSQAEAAPLRQGSLLFHRFLDLLTSAAIKRRSVTYYADQLSVTPKYLSTVCRRESGKSPHEWIREYTLADIAYYLKSTTLTIKEISDRLEFPNLSFFGRFVKEHFGVSPMKYRENLRRVSYTGTDAASSDRHEQ